MPMMPGMPPMPPPGMGGIPPPMASPVAPPPGGLGQPGAGALGPGGLSGAFGPLLQVAKDSPMAISEVTKLMDALSKLVKMMSGPQGGARAARNPMGANIGPADQIAMGQARPPTPPNPLSMLAAQGMRPSGMY